MRLSSPPRTVFVVQSDPGLSRSTRALLETRDCNVRTIRRAKDFNGAQASDIVLLDLEQKRTFPFKLLNELIFSADRPHIILTLGPTSSVFPDDVFPGDRIKVLKHPFAPQDLVAAIEAVQ